MDFPYTVGLTTLVEAFALGIPVICSRNPNFEMDIDKEEIGITVAYNDVEGWINAIRRIAGHPEEAQKMGANARKLAEERFNLEIFSREIAESLLEISKMSPKKRTFA
jgi:glycosyltransferase involved in cell wall biosynthesis